MRWPNMSWKVALAHSKVGWCWEREKIDWQELRKFDCQLVWTIFIFLLSLVNFHNTLSENQILIPDWTYFCCPPSFLTL